METRSSSIHSVPPVTTHPILTGKRKKPEMSVEEKIDKLFKKMDDLQSELFKPVEGENIESYRIQTEKQNKYLKRLEDHASAIPKLQEVYNRQSEELNHKKQTLSERIYKGFTVDENNFQQCFSEFQFLGHDPIFTTTENKEKIEYYYNAFCEYAWNNQENPPSYSQMDTICKISEKVLGEDKVCYFFSCDTDKENERMLIPINRLSLICTNSRYFNNFFQGYFDRLEAIRENPIVIKECHKNLFKEIGVFIRNPSSYQIRFHNTIKQFGITQGTENFFFNLLDKAQYFNIIKLQILLENQLKCFITRENASRIYSDAAKKGFNLLQIEALNAILGLSYSKVTKVLSITDDFFQNSMLCPLNEVFPGRFQYLDFTSLSLSSLERECDINILPDPLLSTDSLSTQSENKETASSVTGIHFLAEMFPDTTHIHLNFNPSIVTTLPLLKQFSKLQTLVIHLQKESLELLKDSKFQLVTPYQLCFKGAAFGQMNWEIIDRLINLYGNKIVEIDFPFDLDDTKHRKYLPLMPNLKYANLAHHFINLDVPTLCPNLIELTFHSLLHSEIDHLILCSQQLKHLKVIKLIQTTVEFKLFTTDLIDISLKIPEGIVVELTRNSYLNELILNEINTWKKTTDRESIKKIERTLKIDI